MIINQMLKIRGIIKIKEYFLRRQILYFIIGETFQIKSEVLKISAKWHL